MPPPPLLKPPPGQLSLPLFDEPGTEPAAPARSPAALPPRPAALPPQKSAPPARAPLADVDSWRETRLAGQPLRYRLRRSTRRSRSIGFQIDDDGLVVTAPRWVRLADVEAGLQSKATWILGKLVQRRERQARLAAQRVDWRDGASLPFLGRPLVLRLDARAPVPSLDAEAALLRLPPPPADADAALARRHMRDLVQAWLQRQAERVFEERVAQFALRLGVAVRAVRLSSAQTRWGTASADGVIRLNWRLVHFALPIIDYVAAHEVAHLREMNHGPRFWATVASIFPEFEQARARLKHEAVPRLD
jgi:predicted metal-dependent hydrolase